MNGGIYEVLGFTLFSCFSGIVFSSELCLWSLLEDAGFSLMLTLSLCVHSNLSSTPQQQVMLWLLYQHRSELFHKTEVSVCV